VGAGDYNADGKPDILWSQTSSGETDFWYMNGITVAGSAYVTPIPPPWTIVGH